MSQEITACQEVCRDFRAWFPEALSLSANIVTIFGVIFATFQYRKWRDQALSVKASELAFELAKALDDLERLLIAARMRPYNNDFDEKDFQEAKRLLREAFTQWRNTTSEGRRLGVLLGREKVFESLWEIHKVLREIAGCLEDAESAFHQQSNAEKWNRLKEFFWTNGGEADHFSNDLDPLFKKLRDELTPIIRMEKAP